MPTKPNHFRKTGVHAGREFTVTFHGNTPVLVQSVSPITGAYRIIWKEGRPMGDIAHGAVSNTRMRSTFEAIYPAARG